MKNFNYDNQSKNNTPLVSVIIVTWNNIKDIESCIESILSQDYSNFNIIVVDNNSSDNTVGLIKAKFPGVILICLNNNIFLTGGNNTGIRYALNKFDSEYIIALNPDTKSDPNLISILVQTASKNEKIGAVGPKVLFSNSTNEGYINSVGLLYDGFMQAYDIGFMQQDKGQFDQEKEVFGVTGACILYKSKMLKEIGIYWNEIQMYLDEVELFIRAHKKKWRVVYTPMTRIYHNYMQSTNKNKSFNKKRQIAKAWLLIALRHYPFKSKIAMFLKFLNFHLDPMAPYY